MRFFKFLIFVLAISGIFIEGCEEFNEHEKYDKPNWIGGKLYTEVAAQEDLTKFAECLRIVGLDTIIDVSGSWTVFAPSDAAIDRFLTENHYTSISDIPKNELEEIVEFHIIQNPWTLLQLHTLNIYGWIDPSNPENKPNAYKHQTLVKNPTEKFWIRKEHNREIIMMDSMAASDYKKVYIKSRKYIPVFFDEFFDIYDLSPEDYSFYFDRPYEPGNIYYADAMVTQSDIFAENGFIHVVDRVVKPMLNAKELLERELPGESYKIFLDLVYQHYPSFIPNLKATQNQPAVRYGGIVDTLFDLSFPGIDFDLHEELTGGSYTDTRFTLASHNGMYIPTDNVFQVFVDEILTAKSGYPHWRDLESLPEDIIEIIVPHHFFDYPLYSTTISRGLRDASWYRVYLNEEDMIRKEFGSNCTFIGMNKYEVSRIFTSVTGPVFLRPSFSTFRRAMLSTWTHNYVSNQWAEYSFFPISNTDLSREFSLMIDWIDRDENQYNFSAISQASGQPVTISNSELNDLIQNHVGTSVPDGSANKEFIRTLGDKYIIWDNANKTVRGSKPTTFGYDGNEIIECNTLLLEEPTDNGKVWQVNSWFNFVDTEMLWALWGYQTFLGLLDQAGLYDPNSNEFSFLERGEYYTIFVPSNQALIDYQADTLSNEDLIDFLKYHFVQWNLIFTDNKQWSGEYETLRKEIIPVPFSIEFSRMNIRTSPDLIEIIDSKGNPYVTIPEAEGVTNIMVTTDSRVTAVIHEINSVLIKQ